MRSLRCGSGVAVDIEVFNGIYIIASFEACFK